MLTDDKRYQVSECFEVSGASPYLFRAPLAFNPAPCAIALELQTRALLRERGILLRWTSMNEPHVGTVT